MVFPAFSHLATVLHHVSNDNLEKTLEFNISRDMTEMKVVIRARKGTVKTQSR